MEKLQERNSNFELLRIIAMLFIVLYHIIIHGQVLGNSVNAGLSIIIYLVMYMTLVHVNSFILLTGFFQSTGKFKQSKVWSLINSSLFYKFLIVIVFSALGILSLSKIELLKVDVTPDRFEQEVALLAQKSDIAEEYDRIKSHIKETRNILKKGGICGKRLDFMMQEFNREANTMASKASNLNITRVAVDLKVLIEQMREQIQNIE